MSLPTTDLDDISKAEFWPTRGGPGPLPLCLGSPLASMEGFWGVCANPKAPPALREPGESRRRTTGEAGPEPAPLVAPLGMVWQVPTPNGLGALPGLQSRLRHPLWSFATVFLKRPAVWGRERHQLLPPSSWAPSAPASCRGRSRDHVASSPLSLSQVTLVNKLSGQEGPSDRIWSS